MSPKPSRTRLNTAGEPLTELRSVPSGDRALHQTNIDALERLQEILDGMGHDCLTRDWYGKVEIAFSVEDGIIQPTIAEHVTRLHR